MRESCLNCGLKHIAQAEVLMTESLLGYPMHKWLAVGHIAEAESELVMEHPDLANEIREARLAYMDGGQFPTMKIIVELLTLLGKKCDSATPKAATQS